MYGLFSRQAGTVPVSRFESKWMTSSGAFSKHGTLPSMKLCVCPQHLQWVRQDEPLWDDLHEGVITSRHLLAILGFREARSARVLGLG